jgi:hypothetical protein
VHAHRDVAGTCGGAQHEESGQEQGRPESGTGCHRAETGTDEDGHRDDGPARPGTSDEGAGQRQGRQTVDREEQETD